MRRIAIFLTSMAMTMLTGYAHASSLEKIEPYINPGVASNLRLSPDGRLLAMLREQGDDNALIILNIDKNKIESRISFPGKYEIVSYIWGNDERIVMKVARKEKDQEQLKYFGELYAVNYDGSKGDFIFSMRTNNAKDMSRIKKREPVRGWADQIITRLPKDKKHILISYQPMSRDGTTTHKVARLNIYNGALRNSSNSPNILSPRFIINEDREIEYAVGSSGYDKGSLYHFTGDEWLKLNTDARPIAINEKGFIARQEAPDGLSALYQYDKAGENPKLLYKHKTVDIASSHKSSPSDVYAVGIEPGFPGYVVLNKKSPEAKTFYKLIKQFGSQYVDITSRSKDAKRMIVKVSSEYDPGTYYLFEEKDGLRPLVSWAQDVKPPFNTMVDPIQFGSFDGLTINGYMSRPDVKGAMPLVVYVHGGPHGPRDWWRYDPTIQILGAHGFRTLQVNFRGSGGYGHNFRRAGYQKWGSDIQQDIISGIEWAIEKGYATKDKICIMGASFGAYSALQSSIMRPDLFQCTIGMAGVYDLPLMYKEGDIIDDYVYGEQYLNDALGTDMAQLTRFSPSANVDKLNSNLLLIHGTKDERTPIEQVESLIKSLDAINYEYEYVKLVGEGHGIFDDENRVEHYQRVVNFLSDNLN